MKGKSAMVGSVVLVAMAIGASQPKAAEVTNTVTVIHLKHVLASEVVDVVRPLVSESAKIAAAPRMNALFVRASQDDLMVIKDVAAQYDQPMILKDLAKVFPLRWAKPSEIAPSLKALLGDKGVVVADDRSSQLVVQAKVEATEAIQKLVQCLDVEVQSGNKTKTTDNK